MSRSTADVDLFTADAGALSDATWSGLREAGLSVDLRRGDEQDPLLGVVRISTPGERAVDVVVGRYAWQAEAVRRAEPGGRVGVPILRAADLVLLKLYAGGPQDAWDVGQLLDAGDRAALSAEVELRLSQLPDGARALWKRIGGSSGAPG